MYKRMCMIVTSISFVALIAACGGSGASPEPATTVTLSGGVQVESSDLSISALPSEMIEIAMSKGVNLGYKVVTPLPSAEISLYKIKADGSEELVSGVSATTDSSGNYTLSDVPVSTTGTGASTDFYYEVRATSGSLEVRAPTAPESDETVALSPETTLTAKMLTDVASVPGKDAPPPPTADMIENTRELSAVDTEELADKSNITTSVSTSEGNVTNMLHSAKALTTANGNSDWMIKAYEAESEAISLKAAGSTTGVPSYLERATLTGCDFNQNLQIPTPVSEKLAEEFIAGTKHVVNDIVEAYNDNRGSEPEVSVDAAVLTFGGMLSDIDSNFSNKTEITSSDAVGLLVKRDLTGAAFAATTELEADQTLAFIQSLYDTPCNSSNVDLMSLVGDLTDTTSLKEPQISHVQIYNTAGGAQGGFVSSVTMYVPATSGLTTSSVTISGGEIGTLELESTDGGTTWASTGQHFVTYGEEVTYTVTATLSDSSTLTETVTRSHPNVVEPESTFADGSTVSDDQDNPTVTTVVRPMFAWSSNTTLGTGEYLKYTYEFSHIDKTDDPISPLGNCPEVATDGKRLYDVTSMMPTVDCDVTACAALYPGKSASNIDCRIYIQAYVVDESDQILGTSAGEFKFYCNDSDGDGNCG